MSEIASESLTQGEDVAAPLVPFRRATLSRRVRLLVAATIAYNVVEAVVALAIAVVAVREGREAWRGDHCC